MLIKRVQDKSAQKIKSTRPSMALATADNEGKMN
jgi:hypothetical protein